MRTITLLVLAILLMVLASPATAQVTNLTINGSNSNFTFVSGSTLSWAYDLPTGDTAYCEVWLDLNTNGLIDPETDRVYLGFLQADGVMDGLNGPPDLDGAPNGHVIFSAPVGIAPGTFVIRFTHNGTSMHVPGTCTPLASPAHTISGKVSVPAGKNARYFVVEASRDGYDLSFWHALTDANGDYVIQTNADTAGGPWYVAITNQPYGSVVISPRERTVYPGLNPTGIDFALELPAAKIAGVVVDENGYPLPEWQVWISRNDNGVYRNQDTDLDGHFELGALGTELNGQTWRVQAGNEGNMSTTSMMALREVPVLQGGDSLYYRLVAYYINSQIQGQVTINGSAPGFPLQLAVWNADTAQNMAAADPATGNFSIGVSDKVSLYQLYPVNAGFSYSGGQVTAYPGQTGIQLNLTTSDIETPGPVVPKHYVLQQNYPNPFNPTTGIRYQVSGASNVKLAVYNLLGQEVATLVNEVKSPGTYTVQFNASTVPSGVYFYRMTAGTFTSTKSMVVLK